MQPTCLVAFAATSSPLLVAFTAVPTPDDTAFVAVLRPLETVLVAELMAFEIEPKTSADAGAVTNARRTRRLSLLMAILRSL